MISSGIGILGSLQEGFDHVTNFGFGHIPRDVLDKTRALKHPFAPCLGTSFLQKLGQRVAIISLDCAPCQHLKACRVRCFQDDLALVHFVLQLDARLILDDSGGALIGNHNARHTRIWMMIERNVVGKCPPRERACTERGGDEENK